MKIWILSSDSSIASTKRLLKATRQSRHETEVLNPLEIQFEFGHKGSSFFIKGKKKPVPDLVLPRLGWKSLSYGLRLCRALQAAGVAVVNSAESLEKASDKLLSLQIFFQLGLPLPQTRYSPLSLKSDLQIFAKTDSHVFKTLRGSQGFGVTWQTNRAQSLAQADAYRTAEVPFLVQELITESMGEDVRALVIGNKVVAAIKRKGPPQELRSNLHQGGQAQKTKLSDEEISLALAATQGLGLFYSGVDFLRTKKGPLLLEANPTPGFDGISRTLGQDLAQVFLASLKERPTFAGNFGHKDPA